MNIAFPAVDIFFLLAPGFPARMPNQKLESEVIDYSPFGAVVAQALLWALVLHGIWIACMRGWSERRGFGEGRDFVAVDDQDLPLASETARFSRVAGDYLVLRYDQVSTLTPRRVRDGPCRGAIGC
ncbi:hypothetical protein ABE522_01105 [Stenotrophomonas pennii]|uniref:hypothetical protein n=1 Tax=Stenotrophomonas lacuserhaii TaxID=2760084 RepID=UPI003208810C